MLTLGDVVFGLGLPSLTGIVLFLLARRQIPIARRDALESASDASGAMPFVLGFAFVVGYLGISQGAPRLPPVEADEWMFLSILAMIVVTVIYQFMWRNAWFLHASSLAVIGFTIGKIVWLVAKNGWSTLETVGAIGGALLAAGVWILGVGLNCRNDPNLLVAAALAVISGLSAAVLSMSGSLTNGQLAATGPAALVPAVLLAIPRRTKLISPDGLPMFVLLYGAPLLCGYLYAEPGVGLLNGLLLFFAPLGLCVGLLPGLRARKIWQRGIVQLAAAVVPAVIAFGLALRKFLIDTAVELPY